MHVWDSANVIFALMTKAAKLNKCNKYFEYACVNDDSHGMTSCKNRAQMIAGTSWIGRLCFRKRYILGAEIPGNHELDDSL